MANLILSSLLRRRFSDSLADGIAVSMSQYGRTTDRTQGPCPKSVSVSFSLHEMDRTKLPRGVNLERNKSVFAFFGEFFQRPVIGGHLIIKGAQV